MNKIMKAFGLVSMGLGVVVGGQARGASAAEGESAPAFVWVQPGVSTFWHTATNRVLTVPVVFPEGASVATLSVRGDKFSANYEVQKVGACTDCTITLPEVKSQFDEDVFALELRFDDEAGTVQNARLGLVRSAAAGNECETRCLAPSDSRKWSKTAGRAVLWVPHDMTSLTVDGKDFDPQLKGDQGWCALTGLSAGQNAQVEMTADGESYSALLRGGPCGLFIVVQ